jgi:hypothetical protein
MVDPGTLSPLPLKGVHQWGTLVEVGYGYPIRFSHEASYREKNKIQRIAS